MEEARRVLERQYPAYDLSMVRTAFATGRFEITRRVRRHLYRKGWDPERISECVLSLGREDFHKSQEHRDRRGVWLDIYRAQWCGERHYVKFVLSEDTESFIVLTFCVDGEQH
ncbi:MAG: type II toxin-antitoxin system MqsR family toxin [Anaerosomatales bacterium]|nr:type II toxin-antitoxin system MqsR family toxin [Anaerosomatales bacterium]MDT8434842.1 type II toxin-antitoxin system MqsR family toxin [Anaerosomatales bacterium]